MTIVPPTATTHWITVEAPDQTPPWFVLDGYNGPVVGQFDTQADADSVATTHNDAVNAARASHMTTPMVDVDSSNIAQLGHDSAAKKLHVLLKDGTHCVYLDVPVDVYDELREAPSIGSYLNRNVKGVYERAS